MCPGEWNRASSTGQGLLAGVWSLSTARDVQLHVMSSANLLAERGSLVPGCKELVCEAAAEKVHSDQLTLTGVRSGGRAGTGQQIAMAGSAPALPASQPV